MIDKERAIAIHNRVISEFGGSFGVRDEGLLESALARFEMTQAYNEEATIFDCDAALTYSLVKNHPFIDGNKRTGAVVCEFVLAKNGYSLKAIEAEKCVVFLRLAAGDISESEFAAWMSDNC